MLFVQYMAVVVGLGLLGLFLLQPLRGAVSLVRDELGSASTRTHHVEFPGRRISGLFILGFLGVMTLATVFVTISAVIDLVPWKASAIARYVIAALAMYLFVSFVFHSLFALVGTLRTELSSGTRVGPDDVDPTPVTDRPEGCYWSRMGTDRFGRTIFEAHYDEGVRYHYFDREASEAERLRRRRSTQDTPSSRNETLLKLGWKGFTEKSPPWEVLGVKKDATESEIKRAYRDLVKKFHPDRFQNLSPREIEELEKDTKLIHAAYDKIMNRFRA